MQPERQNDEGALLKRTYQSLRTVTLQTLMGKQACCMRISCYQQQSKSQILKLRTAIKRIKSKTYEYGYLKEKDKAITAAEADRLAGLDGPTYLAGVL